VQQRAFLFVEKLHEICRIHLEKILRKLFELYDFRRSPYGKDHPCDMMDGKKREESWAKQFGMLSTIEFSLN
jgi:hypothetical protein